MSHIPAIFWFITAFGVVGVLNGVGSLLTNIGKRRGRKSMSKEQYTELEARVTRDVMLTMRFTMQRHGVEPLIQDLVMKDAEDSLAQFRSTDPKPIQGEGKPSTA